MNITERRMRVMAQLQKDRVVTIEKLAGQLGVSSMTVRRDLQLFIDQGLAAPTHGGARLLTTAAEPSFETKAACGLPAKQAIGRLAAGLVDDGDTIIIDCGTTTLQILRYLQAKRVTVITNSVPVISAVSGLKSIRLIVAPGEYVLTSAGMFGTLTIDFFSRIHADKVFVGAHGCSLADGVTEPTLLDAGTKKALTAAGKHKFLLADATKFEHTCLAAHGPLSQFDAIITDDAMDAAYRRRLAAVCRLHVAPAVGPRG
mgnify:CR=1 FL=1